MKNRDNQLHCTICDAWHSKDNWPHKSEDVEKVWPNPPKKEYKLIKDMTYDELHPPVDTWEKNDILWKRTWSKELGTFIEQKVDVSLLLASQKASLIEEIKEWLSGRGCDECTTKDDLLDFLKEKGKHGH